MYMCKRAQATPPLGEPIGSHVTGVKPKRVQQDKFVKELSEVLDMTQKILLGKLLDESSRNSSEDRLRVKPQRNENLSTFHAPVPCFKG